MKKEKYDCTEVFEGLFWRDLQKGKKYHYFAFRQQDGGQIFSSDGVLVGRISWSGDGKTVTIIN